MSREFQPSIFEGDSWIGYPGSLCNRFGYDQQESSSWSCSFGHICSLTYLQDVQARILSIGVLVSPFHVLTKFVVFPQLDKEQVDFVSGEYSSRVIAVEKWDKLAVLTLEKSIGDILGFVGVVGADEGGFFEDAQIKQMEVLAFDVQDSLNILSALIVDADRSELQLSLVNQQMVQQSNRYAVVLNHPQYGYILIAPTSEFDGLYYKVETLSRRSISQLLRYQMNPEGNTLNKKDTANDSDENAATFTQSARFLESLGNSIQVEEPAEYEKCAVGCLKQLNSSFMLASYIDGSASFWHVGSLNVCQAFQTGTFNAINNNNSQQNNNRITDIISEGYLAIALIANCAVLVNWLNIEIISLLEFPSELCAIVKRDSQRYSYYIGDSKGAVYFVRFNVQAMKLEMMNNNNSPVIQISNTKDSQMKVMQLLVVAMKEEQAEDKRDSLLGVSMGKARRVQEILAVSNGEAMSVYSMGNSREQDSLETQELYSIQDQQYYILLGYSGDQLYVSTDNTLQAMDTLTGKIIWSSKMNSPIACGVFLNETELAIAEGTNVHVLNIVTSEQHSYCYHAGQITHILKVKCENAFVTVDNDGIMYKWKNNQSRRSNNPGDEVEQQQQQLQLQQGQEEISDNNKLDSIAAAGASNARDCYHNQVVKLFSSTNNPAIDRKAAVVVESTKNPIVLQQPNRGQQQPQQNFQNNNDNYHNSDGFIAKSIEQTNLVNPSQAEADIESLKRQLSEMKDRLCVRKGKAIKREAQVNQNEDGMKLIIEQLEKRSRDMNKINMTQVVQQSNAHGVDPILRLSPQPTRNKGNVYLNEQQQQQEQQHLKGEIIQDILIPEVVNNHEMNNLERRQTNNNNNNDNTAKQPKRETRNLEIQYQLLKQQVTDLQAQMAQLSTRSQLGWYQQQISQSKKNDTIITINTNPSAAQQLPTSTLATVTTANNTQQYNNINPYYKLPTQNITIPLSSTTYSPGTYQPGIFSNSTIKTTPKTIRNNNNNINTPVTSSMMFTCSPAGGIQSFSLSPTIQYNNQSNVKYGMNADGVKNSNIFVTPLSKAQYQQSQVFDLSQSNNSKIMIPQIVSQPSQFQQSVLLGPSSSPAGKLQLQKQSLLAQQQQLQVQAVYLQQQQEKLMASQHRINNTPSPLRKRRQQQGYDNYDDDRSPTMDGSKSKSQERQQQLFLQQQGDNSNNTLSPSRIYGQSQQLMFQKDNNNQKQAVLPQLSQLESSDQQQQCSTGIPPGSSFTGGARSSILLLNSPNTNNKQDSSIIGQSQNVKSNRHSYVGQYQDEGQKDVAIIPGVASSEKTVEELRKQLQEQALVLRDVQEIIRKRQLGEDEAIKRKQRELVAQELGQEQLLQENALLKNQLALAKSDIMLLNSNNNQMMTPAKLQQLKQNSNEQVDNDDKNNINSDALDRLMEISNRKSGGNGKAPRAPTNSSNTFNSREKKASQSLIAGQQGNQEEVALAQIDSKDNNTNNIKPPPRTFEKILTYDSQNSQMNPNKHQTIAGMQRMQQQQQYPPPRQQQTQELSQNLRNISANSSFEGSIETIKTFDPDDSRMNGQHISMNSNNNTKVIAGSKLRRSGTVDSDILLLNQQLTIPKANNGSRKSSIRTIETIRTFNPDDSLMNAGGKSNTRKIGNDGYTQKGSDEIIEKQYNSRLIKEGDSIKSFVGEKGNDISQDNESDYYPNSFQFNSNNRGKRYSKGTSSNFMPEKDSANRIDGIKGKEGESNGLCAIQ